MSAVSNKLISTVVGVGAFAAVGAYVSTQLKAESDSMDKFFSSYNTPQSEESRKRVFQNAEWDPRTNLMNFLSWKKQ